MIREHWYKPSFWRWWWQNRVPAGTKVSLVLVAIFALGIAGYLSAGRLTESEQVVFTERVTTVTRTVLVKGKPKVITEVRTTRVPVKGETITVQRNGKTVVLTQPGETITRTTTVKGPVRNRVLVKNKTITKTVPRDRFRTITLPGVTLPGSTVTGPERVVTLPERVVTAPSETVVHTQTQTVTTPAQTVTDTQTVTGPTQTVTDTVTNTVTVTETETVTVTEPPSP